MTVTLSENFTQHREDVIKRKALIEQIKANHEKFDPQTEYIYSHYYTPDFSIAELEAIVARTGAFGEPVTIEQVEDITPSFENRCILFPDGNGFYNEDSFNAWVDEKVDAGAFFYGREKACFFPWEAYQIAARMGRREVILENYS